MKMGRLIDQYYFLKEQNNKKRYVFKSGLFYIFLNDDAKYVSEKYNLKLTSFGNEVKVGFPVSAKEKYMLMFKNENIEIVSNDTIQSESNKIIKILNNIDLDNISPKEAIDVLYKLKGSLNGR